MATYKPTTIDKIRQLDPSFITNRQGRDMASYSGLLAYVHETVGIKSQRVTVLQLPAEDNLWTAVAQVSITYGDDTVYEDVGDANAISVGKMIVPHIIRMCITRGKARCHRDKLSLGGPALEELGDIEDDGEGRPAPKPQPVRAAAPRAVQAPVPDGMATPKQVDLLHRTHARLVSMDPRTAPLPEMATLTLVAANDLQNHLIDEGMRLKGVAEVAAAMASGMPTGGE